MKVQEDGLSLRVSDLVFEPCGPQKIQDPNFLPLAGAMMTTARQLENNKLCVYAVKNN